MSPWILGVETSQVIAHSWMNKRSSGAGRTLPSNSLSPLISRRQGAQEGGPLPTLSVNPGLPDLPGTLSPQDGTQVLSSRGFWVKGINKGKLIFHQIYWAPRTHITQKALPPLLRVSTSSDPNFFLCL